MEETSWTDCVRNEEELHRVKERRNILHKEKRRRAHWIGHTLRRKFLKHLVEGKIDATGRQKRRRMQLLDDLKKTR
jgi:hypothetical protein